MYIKALQQTRVWMLSQFKSQICYWHELQHLLMNGLTSSIITVLFGPSNHHVYLVIIFSFSFTTIVKTTQSDVLDRVLFELVCSLIRKKGERWSKSLPCPLRLPVIQTTGAWRRNLERDSWPDWSYRTFFKWVFREEWKVTIKFTLALRRTHLETGIS